MTEIRRIVSRGGDGRRPVTLLDLHDPTTPSYYAARGTFKYTPPTPQDRQSKRSSRFGGARTIGQSHENATVAGNWRVKGSTKPEALDRANALVRTLQQFSLGAYFMWQPDGASYPSYAELRGPGTWDGTYQWVDFQQTNGLDITLTWLVAPLWEWDEMDVWDDFAVNSIADYAFDVGGGTLSVSAGALIASTAAQKVFYHSARGYSYGDVQATWRFTTGASGTACETRCIIKRLDASNYLYGGVGTDGTARVGKRDAGVDTDALATSTAAGSLTANTTYWSRYRIEGNLVIAEFFQYPNPPSPMATPVKQVIYALTAAEAIKFGALVGGSTGGRFSAPPSDWRFEDFWVEPYDYRNRTLPEVVRLRSIPGPEKAKVDAWITPSGGSAAPVWALLGWTPAAQPYNFVWNGDFEDDVNGWSVALVTGVQAVAGTSITRVTTAARLKYGTAAGEVVTPASSGAGANFPIYRRFKKGQLYTAELYQSSAAGVTSMVLKLGVNGDVATSAGLALTTTPTRITVTWTPAADVEVAYVSIQTNAATATTFDVDAVQVYEGATAPTVATQSEGRGAAPPFGVLNAASCDTGDLSTWTITADANALSGFSLQATPAASGTASATWLIDPSLLTEDDFAQGDLGVQVFARVRLDPAVVSPILTLSATPEAGTNYGAQRYSDDWGSSGHLLTLPITSASYRVYLLGVVHLRVDGVRPVRWKLKLDASWATSTSGANGFSLDRLYLVPAQRRAAGYTAKPNDTTYPRFARLTAETIKRITSDLQVYTGKPSQVISGQLSPDSPAMGGSLLEFDEGDLDVLLAMSSLVPDDPTVDATTDLSTYAAAAHFAVTPRSYHARGS